MLALFGLPATVTANVTQEIDGLRYTLDTATKTASVELADQSLTAALIPETVSYEELNYKVTSVAPEGFMSSQIADLSLPQTITTIGEKAFYGCQKLTEVTIPENVTTIGVNGFYNCRRLTKVNWNAIKYKGAEDLNEWFIFSNTITEVSAGENVKNFPGYIFAGQTNLSSLNFTGSVLSTIGSSAFKGCTNLSELNFPNSLESIGSKAFYGCESLKEITIPENVTSIGTGAFVKCKNLKKITYNARSFGEWADDAYFDDDTPFFDGSNDSDIEEIYLGPSVTEVPYCLFANLGKLKKLELNEGLTRIGHGTFLGCLELEDFKLPTSIKEIGAAAFLYCTHLTKFQVSRSVFNLSNLAFGWCSGLEAIKIESAIVNSSAFEKCTGLKRVCLNSDELKEKVFADCNDIQVIYSLTEFPPITDASAFSKYDGVTVYIPVGSLSEYKNDEVWKNFSDIRESDFADLDKLLWGEGQDPEPEPEPELTSIEIDGVVYSLDKETHTATVSGHADSLEEAVIYGTITAAGELYNVKSIDDEAFRTASINSLLIGEGIEQIGASAFESCSALANIDLPSTLTKIGDRAFMDCEAINSLRIPDPNKWAQIDFESYYYNATCNPMCYAKHVYFGSATEPATQLVIENVQHISQYAFFGAEELQTVMITGNENIGRAAFANLSSLQALCLETSSIAEDNFIGGGTFDVYSLTKTPPTIEDETVFNHYAPYVTLYVPKGSVEAYKTAFRWQDFGNIVESDFSNLGEIFGVDYVPDFENPTKVTVNGIEYALDYEALTATVTGKVDEELVNVVIPETLTVEGIRFVVTEIGIDAFEYSNIESIELPLTITKIGDYAFYSCSGLTEFTVGENVTSIGSLSVAYCENLNVLYYNAISCSDPEGMTFFSNSQIRELIIGDKVKRIPGSFFRGVPLEKLLIPDNVEEIGNGAFSECKELQEVTFGLGVKRIGDWAFVECSGLTSIHMSDKLEVIGESAFEACSGLTELTIPDSVTEIGKYAYYGCSGIQEVTVGLGLKRVGAGAFDYWDSLNKLTFNAIDCEDLVTIDDEGNHSNGFRPNVTEAHIGDQVRRIPGALLAFNESLASVDIPNSVEEIGWSAFQYCTGLTELNIPDAVINIDSYAISECTGLKEVTIGTGVEHMELTAFYGCENVETLNFNSIDCDDLYYYDEEEGMNYLNGFYPNVTSVKFGDQVRHIPGGIIGFNPGLTEVEIPASVETIGRSAFYDCTGLQNVVLNSLDTWAQMDLDDGYANPIYYAESFTVKGNDKPVEHLDLKGLGNINWLTFLSAQNLKTVRLTDCYQVSNFAFQYSSNITDICLDVEYMGYRSFDVYNKFMRIYSLTELPPAYTNDPLWLAEDVTLHDITLYVPVGCKAVYGADPFWGQMNIVESEMTDLDRIFEPDYVISGVGSVLDSSEAVYFTLDGVRVQTDRLEPGTYIKVENGKSTKLLVK